MKLFYTVYIQHEVTTDSNAVFCLIALDSERK